MTWLQFSVTAPQAQAALLELLFENLGALSVTFGDAADEPILEPDPGEQRLWSHTRVSALFDAEQNAEALDAALRRALPAEIAPSLSLERLGDRAWERAWMDGFHPMRFGNRLWVCPSGMQVDAADALVLDLDPGLAFGTGTHPTTALCLEWLDALASLPADAASPLAGTLVVDYGCGSGILAIAALRLGARAAIGVDLDPQALLATRDNAIANDAADRLTVCAPEDLGVVLHGRKADILLANILAGPLQELLPEFAARLRPGGQLALSGILADQAEALSRRAATWFEIEPPEIREEWVRLSGRRKVED